MGTCEMILHLQPFKGLPEAQPSRRACKGEEMERKRGNFEAKGCIITFLMLFKRALVLLSKYPPVVF